MGSLASKVDRQPWKKLRTPRPVRITLFGLPDAGHGRLLLNIAPYGDAPPNIVTTIEKPGEAVQSLERGLLTMTEVDIGMPMPKGSENRLKDTLRKNADGFVFVVSASSQDNTFPEAAWNLDNFVLGTPELDGVPVLCLITHTDAEGAHSYETVQAGIADVLRKHAYGAEDFTFLRANPSTGEGLYEGLGWLVSRLNTMSPSSTDKQKDLE